MNGTCLGNTPSSESCRLGERQRGRFRGVTRELRTEPERGNAAPQYEPPDALRYQGSMSGRPRRQ